VTTTDGVGDSALGRSELPVVLFVDDEKEVLEGLRMSLRRQRRIYDLLFVSSAAEAVDILAERRIDVLVTDMRMPVTTGADLLNHVHSKHPGVVRYVLSGEADRSLVLEAIGHTHRWLVKPCDRELLVGALADAVQHRALLQDPRLRALVTATDVLASPPALYTEIYKAITNEKMAISRVVELTEADPGVSAKLLQWANSAFSGGQRVSDLRGAVMRIGLESLSQLVLAAEIVSALQATVAIPGLDSKVLHRHVEVIARCAAMLAAPELAMTTRVGSALSQVGLLLEAGSLPDRLSDSYAYAIDAGVSLVEAERQLFGITHPEIGACLLALWGLPPELVMAVGRSHEIPTKPALGPPMSSSQAIRFGRLLAQRRPHAAEMGLPYLDPISEELEVTLSALV
jgi:HD-like signal output (HDOD) protein/CheY-like chemotaxis protein